MSGSGQRDVEGDDILLWVVRAFAAFHRRSPAEMGAEEVRAFLLHVVEVRRAEPSNHKMHVAGIKFLYREVLGRPDVVDDIPYPFVPDTLPDVPSQQGGGGAARRRAVAPV